MVLYIPSSIWRGFLCQAGNFLTHLQPYMVWIEHILQPARLLAEMHGKHITAPNNGQRTESASNTTQNYNQTIY
jgi:hypothetical protein